MPFGEAAAAAIAPALVSASAMAATAAVRLPLQRRDSTGTGARGAYGASWGTLSCTSERIPRPTSERASGRVTTGSRGGGWGSGTVGAPGGVVGGTVKPGGGDPGGWAGTAAGSVALL